MAMVEADLGKRAAVGFDAGALGSAGVGLAKAIDDLDAAVAGLVDGDFTEAVMEVAGLRSRLDAVEHGLVNRFDRSGDWSADGYRHPTSAIKDRCGIAKSAAAGKVRRARRLESMPVTAAAWRAGLIDIGHVDRLARANQPHRAAAFADAEAMLVDNAIRLPFRDFDKAVRYFEQLTEPDPADDDDSGGATDRSMHLSPILDGYGKLDATLDPIGNEIATRVLRKIEQELFAADWAEAIAEHGDGNVTIDTLRRTPAQRRHDALIEALLRTETAPADGKRPEPVVIVHMDFQTFEAELKRRVGAPFEYPAQRLCELDNGTPITPGQALALAVEGHVRRYILDAPGERLRFGRKARFFTGGLRAFIQARDRTCTGPGCEVPAYECDIDHVIDWQHHGETDDENGDCKCTWHHRHKDHYTITTDPVTGRARWRRKP